MILINNHCSDINIDSTCSVTVSDSIKYSELTIEKETKDGEYLTLNSNDFISIYIAQLNTAKESKIIYYKILEDPDEEATLKLETDGYINLYHIIIPLQETVHWDDDIIYNFRLGHYYYLDGIFSKVIAYKKRVGDTYGTFYKLEPIEVEDLINEIVNINEQSNDYIPQIRYSLDMFSICHLRKCYKNICQTIFNSRIFDKCFKAKVNSDLIFRRDLVWATINVIQYLVDSKQFAEAQLVLERINECPGLCTEQEKESGKKGCGCK